MPLAQRSALATVPGVPAWGAVAIAVAATLVGFVIDAVRGNELTAAFSVFFFLGCLAAILAVRNRGLFTAMVQPPLILVVAVPLAYQQFSPGGGGLKDLLLNVAIPLVNRFPLMLATTLVVCAIGAGRMYIRHQAAGIIARPARRSGSARRTETEPRTVADRTETVAEPDRPREQQRSERPVRRPAGRSADPSQPAHAPGSFPTGRYPARAAHSESSEERTESFDRPQQFARPHERAPRPDRPAQHDRPDRTQGRRYEAAPAQPGPAYTGSRPAARAEGHEYGSEPEVPLHPIPQVRYRDRGDTPQDPPYRYR